MQLIRKGTFVLLLFCFWNQSQNWNSKTCLVTNEWKILRNQIGWVKLVETYKSRLLKLLLLIIVWLWSPLLGWITINCSPDQFLILHLIRRTLYHLFQEDDLSTSMINIYFVKIYLTLFSEIVKFYGNIILLECRNLYVLLYKII